MHPDLSFAGRNATFGCGKAPQNLVHYSYTRAQDLASAVLSKLFH